MSNSENDSAANRQLVKEKHEHIVRRLADELDHMLKMAAFTREALKNEMMDGFGYKQLAVNDKFLKKLKELSAVMDTLTASKIRLDKSAKALADAMTPEEERQAVIAYLKAAAPEDRAKVLTEVNRWQRNRAGAGNADTDS